jgi:hypothetical protein
VTATAAADASNSQPHYEHATESHRAQSSRHSSLASRTSSGRLSVTLGCYLTFYRADQATATLASIVKQLTQPLYELFSSFEIPDNVISEELEKLQSGV